MADTTYLRPNVLVNDYAYTKAIVAGQFAYPIIHPSPQSMGIHLILPLAQSSTNFGQMIRKVAAGLVAFVPAARVLAADINRVVEKFVKGRVLEVTPQLLVVETPEWGEVVVLLSPTTQIWDDGLAKDIPIEIGDTLTVWAASRRRGVCEAERLWVNWVSLHGRVTNLRETQTGVTFELHPLTPQAVSIKVDPHTQLVTHDLSVAFTHGASLLTDGEAVQLIGRRLKDGSVLATTVSLPER